MAPPSIHITHDTLTPFLRQMQASAVNLRPIVRSMGNTVLGITQRNFNSVGAAFRPLAWKAKRDGTPSNLQQSTTLAHSWRLNVSATQAVVSTDRIYAAIHQFGGVIKPKTASALRFQSGGRWWTVKQVTMPARPMLPITPDGRLTDKAAALVLRAGMRAFLRQTGATT